METAHFFTLSDGRDVTSYALRRGAITAKICDWGGALIELWTPNGNGDLTNVVLRHQNPADYEINNGYLGALIGRYANRIRGGTFRLNGKVCQIPCNERNRTALHGGNGLSHRLWTAEVIDDATLKLTIESPDGDSGFPGKLSLVVVYQLTSDNALQITYAATSTMDTVVNFTNHAYFNLSGLPGKDISKTMMKIKADMYTEVDKFNIPTGWLQLVNGTPFDLRKKKALGKLFAELPHGFDHNFIFKKTKSSQVDAVDPESKIRLEMFTTEPAVQLYTAGFIDSSYTLYDGVKGRPFLGFCLEAQHYPDSPNHPEWPSVVLKAGQVYRQLTKYRFSTRGKLTD